jgi:hypothetical protein
MNQGPTEPLVLIKNKGTQGLGFESDKPITNSAPKTSLENTFVQGGIITPEGENYEGLTNLFDEICVL